MQTDVKTHCLNQREHHNHTTHVKRKPAETQCFRRFCGRGRRTWSPLRSGRLVACVPLARTRPSARGFGVDVGKCSKEQGGPVLSGSPNQVQKGRCWFGAAGEFRGTKRAKNPRKNMKYVDENRHGPYKKCRDYSRRGVCCRQAVSHSLTLHREGVMRMGHKGCGVRALRFVICVVAALAVAIALAPKAC